MKRITLVTVFNEHGKLLLGKRRDTGKWTIVAGHIEEGETPLKGALREMYEEAGFKPDRLVHVEDIKLDHAEFSCYRATVKDQVPTNKNDPDDEVLFWRWVDVSDGIPKDIAEHLAGPKDPDKNYTIKACGLKKSIRYHEPELRDVLAKNDDPEDEIVFGKRLATGQPASIPYHHSRSSIPTAHHGERFGQHVEPAGQYMGYHAPSWGYMADHVGEPRSATGSTSHEYGVVHFKNPLVVDGENTRDWKEKLSAAHGNRRNKTLSTHLMKLGHDGVIGRGLDGRIHEMVNLSAPKDVMKALSTKVSKMHKAEGKPMPPTLVLVRHGATDFNSGTGAEPTERLRGWLNVPLNDQGREEAEKAGKLLEGTPVAQIVASDLDRTIETAKAVQRHTEEPPLTTTPLLRPWHLGEMHGQPLAKVLPEMLYFLDHDTETPPGGEPFVNFQRRAMGFLMQLLEQAKAQPEAGAIVAVSHSREARLLKGWVQGGCQADGSIDKKPILSKEEAAKTGHLLVLQWNGETWELKDEEVLGAHHGEDEAAVIKKAEALAKADEDQLLQTILGDDHKAIGDAFNSPSMTAGTIDRFLDRPDLKTMSPYGASPAQHVLTSPAVNANHLNRLTDLYDRDGERDWQAVEMLRKIARHPAGTDTIHRQLLRHEPLVGDLLHNKRLSPEIVNGIYDKYRQQLNNRVADTIGQPLGAHPNLSPDRLASLAEEGYKLHNRVHGNFKASQAAVKNPALPHEVLEQVVRSGLPENQPPLGFGELPPDPENAASAVRREAVQNPNLTSDLASTALKDVNHTIPMSMFGWDARTDRNRPPVEPIPPAVSPEHVQQALNQPNSDLQVAAIRSPMAQPKHVMQFVQQHPKTRMWHHALESSGMNGDVAKWMIDNYPQIQTQDSTQLRARSLAEEAKRFPEVKEHLLSSPKLAGPIAKELVNGWTMNHGGKMDLSDQDWARMLRHENGDISGETAKSSYLPEHVVDQEVAAGALPYHVRKNLAMRAQNPDTLRSLAVHIPTADETHIADYLDKHKEVTNALASLPEDHIARKWHNDFQATFNKKLGVGLQHRNPFIQWARQAVPGSFQSKVGIPEEADKDILSALAWNKHTPTDLQARLVQHPTAAKYLAMNHGAAPEHLRQVYHDYQMMSSDQPEAAPFTMGDKYSQEGRKTYEDWLIRNPNTPSDVLHNIAQKDMGYWGGGIANHSNATPETLRFIAQNPHAYEGARREAKEMLTLHSPDDTHSQRVNVQLGTNKLRKIRDYIQSQGATEMSPKQLPPGDWSAGRNAKGNIDVNKLQEAIDKTPGMKYNVSHDEWNGAQRHNEDPSKVFQLNLTNEHVNKMKQEGVWDAFRKFHDATMQSGHPVTPSTLGWVRYTDNSDEDPNENPNATHEERVASWRQKLGRELERHSDDLEDAERRTPDYNTQDCPHCDGAGHNMADDGEGGEIDQECPECSGSGNITDEDVPHTRQDVQDMRHEFERTVSGKNPPEQGSHNDYIHWAREHAGVPRFAAELEHAPNPNDKPGERQEAAKGPRHVFIDEIQSDFGQSFSKQLAADARRQADEEADAQGMNDEQREAHRQTWINRAKNEAPDLSDDVHQKISSTIFGGKKANEVLGEAFLQHLRDKGHHDAKVQIHSVKSKAPISLARPNDPVPGHFKHTYEELPKKLGFEGSKYGTLEGQDNPDLQDQPTHEGVVRKCEEGA